MCFFLCFYSVNFFLILFSDSFCFVFVPFFCLCSVLCSEFPSSGFVQWISLGLLSEFQLFPLNSFLCLRCPVLFFFNSFFFCSVNSFFVEWIHFCFCSVNCFSLIFRIPFFFLFLFCSPLNSILVFFSLILFSFSDLTTDFQSSNFDQWISNTFRLTRPHARQVVYRHISQRNRRARPNYLISPEPSPLTSHYEATDPTDPTDRTGPTNPTDPTDCTDPTAPKRPDRMPTQTRQTGLDRLKIQTRQIAQITDPTAPKRPDRIPTQTRQTGLDRLDRSRLTRQNPSQTKGQKIHSNLI